LRHFLEMKNITKQFNGNVVLKNVNFFADKGQVHAIIGENGAGKTTLMKILAGLFPPDSGDIFINGQRVHINGPKHAQELGIAMIYQECRLFPDLNVTENIFIRREPLKKLKFIKIIDWAKAHKETYKYLDYFGLNINPKTAVSNLSAGQQKFIEIIKALSQNANIIIMDEPTVALTEQETELLFKVIKDLKKLGITVIYISHRVEEIKKIADLVSVIRDGELIVTKDINTTNIHELIKAMSGKEVYDKYPKLKVKTGKNILRVENLSYNDKIKNINFELSEGEILGITGLTDSGKDVLARVLFGIVGPFQGKIYINGKAFKSMDPYTAKINGLCFVSAIDTEEGLISNMPTNVNITITNLQRISTMGFIDNAAESYHARDMIERLEIGCNENDIISILSGGKKKKVIFAKWLFTNSKIFIIDEPSAGIDICSKVDIYNIINELVLSGTAIIMVSSNIEEIIGMCDKILVMYNGEIRKVLDREHATEQKILYYASGGKDD